LLWLFVKSLKKKNHQPQMITQNSKAREVFFLLMSRGFAPRMAMYITAQAGHETGDFTSRIFKENNNCFGMKKAYVRKTMATGEQYGHATYKDLKSCIEDFYLYYNSFKYLKQYESLKAYVSAIKKRGYFEASESEYLAGCERFMQKYFSEEPAQNGE